MASVARLHCLAFASPSTCKAAPFSPKRRRFLRTFSALTTPPSVGGTVEEDIMQEFYMDRELNGDFVTRISNTIFWRQATNSASVVESDSIQPSEEVLEEGESEGGFLKLAATKEWLMGESPAPVNKKITLKELQDDRERRKKLNFLMYDALKKELLLLTLGVGAACTGYCLVIISLQAGVSYAVGVAFSYLYFQLLCQYADKMSRDNVPDIFMLRREKKIGIRSEDLNDFLEKSIRGTGIALSSPRLVIPATIFGLWVLSHRYITNDFFDFQIVPAMLGLFAYKAAALVQVYRDNEDLNLIFPQDEDKPY